MSLIGKAYRKGFHGNQTESPLYKERRMNKVMGRTGERTVGGGS